MLRKTYLASCSILKAFKTTTVKRKSRDLICLTILINILVAYNSVYVRFIEHPRLSEIRRIESEKLRAESEIPLSSINEWREQYISSSDKIPVGSYMAVYFRRSDPDNIIHKENVPQAVINYTGSSFQDLEAQEFGGYWVGDFDFKEDETRYFHILQGAAKSRILVDGEIIYEGDRSKSIPFLFQAGRHRIEIQHQSYSSWLSTSVHVQPEKVYSGSPPPQPTSSSTIVYAGTQKSSSINGEVTLLLQPAPTPIHLYLSSFRPVTWNIKQTAGAELAGVHFSSHEPGTEVILPHSSIPIQQLSAEELPVIHTLGDPRCHKFQGKLYCESWIHPGDKLKTSISKLTGGLSASGFSGQYDSQALVVPEQTLSQRDYAKFAKKTEKLQKRGEKQQ